MDTRCIVVQRWGSATREAEKERRGEGVESSSAASALWRSNIQTSRSFAVCQILSSAPIGARVPLILLRRLFLHLLLWSRSKSTLPPPPPPLRRVSPSPSLSLPFAQTIPKRLCRRLMPMLACAAGNNDLPSSPSLPYPYLFLFLSPPISVYILLSGWIPWIQMYIQRHTDGGEKEIEGEERDVQEHSVRSDHSKSSLSSTSSHDEPLNWLQPVYPRTFTHNGRPSSRRCRLPSVFKA